VLPLTLLVLGCVEPVPCAPGYGRTADGVCLAVVSSDTAGADAAELPASAADTGGTGAGADPGVEPWLPSDIQSALAESIGVGPPTPTELHAAWIGVFDGAIPNCPGAPYDFTRGVEGCSTPAGWVYTGPADHDAGEGNGVTRWALEADSTARRPDGTLLVVGGVVSWRRQVREDGSRFLVGFVEGTFADDRGAGWLGRGASTRWSWVGDLTADGVLDLTIDGGFTPHRGTAVRFEELVLGPACPGATGTVHVRRNTDARWAQVALSCSSCGPATFDGVEVGEVCLDMDTLTAHLLRLEVE